MRRVGSDWLRLFSLKQTSTEFIITQFRDMLSAFFDKVRYNIQVARVNLGFSLYHLVSRLKPEPYYQYSLRRSRFDHEQDD